MNKQFFSKTFAIFLALSFALSNSAMLMPIKVEAGVDTIGICHATNADVNPYNKIFVAKNAIAEGHDGDNGGVYPIDPWGDIIPPYDYSAECPNPSTYTELYCAIDATCYTGSGEGKKCGPLTQAGTYLGKNWPEGQAIWDNNCVIPATCGDGQVNQPSEQCDDGNITDDDGCSSTCEIEQLNGSGILQGRKYKDTNKDGIHNDVVVEPRLSNWTVNLYDNNWNLLGSQVTQEDPIGQYKFENLSDGTYYLCEEMKEGWQQTGPKEGTNPVDLDGQDIPNINAVAVENESSNSHIEGPICWEVDIEEEDDPIGWLKFGNIENPPVIIIASKVICDEEQYLPNWGAVKSDGNPITETTAQDWVDDSESHCWLDQGWEFEWGYENVLSTTGDFIGTAGDGWTTFNSTVGITDLQDSNKIWMREVLKEGYIPFSGPPNPGDDFSAEFYCSDDVLNYDNYEYIDSPVLGETYYCVGFNTLIEEEEPEPVCEPGLNLLKNGSFEFPEVTDSKKWQLFPSSAIGLEWLVNWVDTLITDPALLELQAGVNGWLSSEGDQHAELDSNHPTMISQEVNTESAYEYKLTFDFSARPNTELDNNKLEIWADSNLLDTIQKENPTNQTVWESKIYNFVASTNLAEIKFVDAGIDDSFGTLLDNVGLECIGLAIPKKYTCDKNTWKCFEDSNGQYDLMDCQVACEEPPIEPICGNGTREGNEQCDPPSTIISIQDNEFCDQNCEIVPIYNGGNSCPQETNPVHLESYPININGWDIDGETVALTGGKTYLFQASETFHSSSDQKYLSDAGYTTIDNWSNLATQYGIQGTPPDYAAHVLLGDLGLGVGVINWGNYDPSHEYNFSYTIPLSSTSTQFVIGDRWDNWFIPDDLSWNNQGGMGDNTEELILDIFECVPEKPIEYSDVTICKYDEQREPLEGWNMLLKGDYVEGVTVYPSNVSKNNNEVSTSSDLPLDDYLLIASEQYTYRPNTLGAENSDAGYTKRNCPGDASYLCSGFYSPWFNVYDIIGIHQGYLGIMINDVATNWGSYFNSLHTYATSFVDYSGPFDFTIKDDVYIDNSGELYVDIYKGYSGYTSSDGCVTFTDVSLGTYEIGEILKDGWQNLSGLNQVVINGTQGNFIVINKSPKPLVCDPEIELLQNGGFETPEVTNIKEWDIFPSGTTGLGWLVSWFNGYTQHGDPQNPTQRPTIANLELQAGYNNWLSSEGDQYAELDTDWDGPDGTLSGEPASVAISQEIPTIIGETYKLTFDFSPRPGLGIDENWLKAFVDGTEAFDQTADGFITGGQTSWSNNEYSFIAQNNLTTIKFEDGGSANSLGTFLDNVSLRCIPEEEPTNFNCIDYRCVASTEETGQYPDQTTCEAACVQPSGFNCIDYTCVASTQGAGAYADETTCTSVCHSTTTTTSAGITSFGGQYAFLGTVLGAATEKEEVACTPYLLEYIKLGAHNNPEEVKKLQLFLNEYLGLNLEVSGIYDQATYKAVKQFQLLMKDDILAPWVAVGCLPSENIATGYVYRTTKWAINNIFCPELKPDVSDETCKYIGFSPVGGVVAGAATSTVGGTNGTTTTTTTKASETIGDTTTTVPQENGQSQSWFSNFSNWLRRLFGTSR